MKLAFSRKDRDRVTPGTSQGIHDGQELQLAYRDYALTLVSGHSHFATEARERIIADLARGLPEFDVAEYFGTQPTVFADYDFLVVARAASGEAVGLIGARWLDAAGRRILYLWTAMLADAYRSTRLYARMKAFMMATVMVQNGGVLPEFIVTKTYNPRVMALLRHYFQPVPGVAIYPRIPGAQAPEMRELAQAIACSLWPALPFEADSGVLRGGQASVSPNFFPRMEFCRDEAINTHFRSKLTREDQVVCIVHVSLDASKSIAREILNHENGYNPPGNPQSPPI